jgi:hypothetical protein
MNQASKRLFAAVCLATATSAAWAQFPQYIPPGSLGIPEVEDREELQKSVGNARWRVGPLRVQPYVVVRDVGYVDNVFPSGNKVSDFTATAGGGLKVYLPVGNKFTLAAHALPEYVWWKKFDDLSGWRHRAGIGAFAYFNRLGLELKYTNNDLLQYVSHEFDSPGDIKKDRLELNAEVDVGGPLAVFGGVSRSDWEYDDNGFQFAFPDQLELLDRTEDVSRAGIKYKRRSGFEIGVGYEQTEVDFESERRDRSSEGDGLVVTLAHTGARIGAAADFVYRDIQERDNSDFRRFKAWTGQGRLQYRTEGRFGASIFGNRQIVYSLAQGTSYFTDQRLGVSLDVRMGWRTNLRAFLESGTDEYEPVTGNVQLREDDFDTIGAEFQMKLQETSTLLAGFSRTEYDSNVPGFDRELTTIRITVNFGGGFLGW